MLGQAHFEGGFAATGQCGSYTKAGLLENAVNP
jgi:hypothetical protein